MEGSVESVSVESARPAREVQGTGRLMKDGGGETERDKGIHLDYAQRLMTNVDEEVAG